MIHFEGSRAARGVRLPRLFAFRSRFPAQQPSAALPYTVVTREARRPLATRVIGGQEMFALDDLARLFNLTVREDAAAGGLTVTVGHADDRALAAAAARLGRAAG